MHLARTAGWAGLLAVTLGAVTNHHVRKEHVQLRVTTRAGTPGQVRVITRGLLLITAPPAPKRQPWQLITTVPVPGDIWLAGVGQADVRLVDTAGTLVVDVTQTHNDTAPPKRFTGHAIRVSRANYGDPFRIIPFDDRAPLRRR